MQIFASFYIFLLDITHKCNYTKNKSNPFLRKFVDVLNGRPKSNLLQVNLHILLFHTAAVPNRYQNTYEVKNNV